MSQPAEEGGGEKEGQKVEEKGKRSEGEKEQCLHRPH